MTLTSPPTPMKSQSRCRGPARHRLVLHSHLVGPVRVARLVPARRTRSRRRARRSSCRARRRSRRRTARGCCPCTRRGSRNGTARSSRTGGCRGRRRHRLPLAGRALRVRLVRRTRAGPSGWRRTCSACRCGTSGRSMGGPRSGAANARRRRMLVLCGVVTLVERRARAIGRGCRRRYSPPCAPIGLRDSCTTSGRRTRGVNGPPVPGRMNCPGRGPRSCPSPGGSHTSCSSQSRSLVAVWGAVSYSVVALQMVSTHTVSAGNTCRARPRLGDVAHRRTDLELGLVVEEDLRAAEEPRLRRARGQCRSGIASRRRRRRAGNPEKRLVIGCAAEPAAVVGALKQLLLGRLQSSQQWPGEAPPQPTRASMAEAHGAHAEHAVP